MQWLARMPPALAREFHRLVVVVELDVVAAHIVPDDAHALSTQSHPMRVAAWSSVAVSMVVSSCAPLSSVAVWSSNWFAVGWSLAPHLAHQQSAECTVAQLLSCATVRIAAIPHSRRDIASQAADNCR